MEFRALDKRGLTALASGHAVADLCQGAVPALIPFLIAERGYSYSAVGALLLFVTVGSSIIQPAFGALRAKLELGRASFDVAAGQSATVKVKLAAGTAKLAKKKKLAVTARVGEKASKLTLKF